MAKKSTSMTMTTTAPKRRSSSLGADVSDQSDAVSWCEAKNDKFECRSCGKTTRVVVGKPLPWSWFERHSKCQP